MYMYSVHCYPLFDQFSIIIIYTYNRTLKKMSLLGGLLEQLTVSAQLS